MATGTRNGSLFAVSAAGSVVAFAAAALAYKRRREEGEHKKADHDGDEQGEEGITLSHSQKMFLDGVSKGQDQMTNVILLETIDSDTPYPTVRELERAIATVKRTDETLSAAFVYNGDDEHVRLVSNEETTKISGILTVEEDDDWQSVAAKCRNTIHFPPPPKSTDGMVPTWKIFYVPNQGAITFVLNHVLFDGSSAQRLQTTFVDILNAKEHGGSSPQQLPAVKLASVHKAYSPEYFLTHNLNRSLWRVGLEVFHSALVAWFYRNSAWLVPLNDAPGRSSSKGGDAAADDKTKHTPSGTNQIFSQLTEDQTKAMLRASKARKVTVHATLTTALNIAMVQLWSGKDDNKKVASSTPSLVRSCHLVSRWKLLPKGFVENKSVLSGCFIGVAFIDVPVLLVSEKDEEDRCWSMASRVHYWLHKHPAGLSQPTSRQHLMSVWIKARHILDRFLYGSKMGHISHALRTGTGAVPLFAITNNGVLRSTTTTDSLYRIGARYACSSRHHMPSELGVLFVQTVEGRMNFSWNYPMQLYSEGKAMELTKLMLQALSEMCGFALKEAEQ